MGPDPEGSQVQRALGKGCVLRSRDLGREITRSEDGSHESMLA